MHSLIYENRSWRTTNWLRQEIEWLDFVADPS